MHALGVPDAVSRLGSAWWAITHLGGVTREQEGAMRVRQEVMRVRQEAEVMRVRQEVVRQRS